MNPKAFHEVQMPPRIARMATDRRGYPIPYTVMYVNGVPDFTAVDPKKWLTLLKIQGCGICGGTLHGRMFFVGGPLCAENRLFFDHPMHEECATYALQVCPFLCIPKMHYRKETSLPPGANILKSVSKDKPDVFMLGSSRGYDLMRNGKEVLLHAQPWDTLRWWKEGVEITDQVEVVHG